MLGWKLIHVDIARCGIDLFKGNCKMAITYKNPDRSINWAMDILRYDDTFVMSQFNESCVSDTTPIKVSSQKIFSYHQHIIKLSAHHN